MLDGSAHRPKPTRLSYLPAPRGHPWNHTTDGLEAALQRAGLRPRFVPDGAVWRIPAKVLARLGLARRAFARRNELIVAPLMGLLEYRLVPHGYAFETIPYVFDCWPASFSRWEAYFGRHRPRMTFFTARDCAEYFQGRTPGMSSAWMPEATEPERYDRGQPLKERSLDVLELGRRYPHYHESIRQALQRADRSHRFEPVPGRIIFPTFGELVVGLAEARVSICFPSSLTHPARSGWVETVTHRYFESMASGCLIVGHCPAELRDLFGYDPLIAADLEDPAGQILRVLDDIDTYQPLVDRNYVRLLEVGTWDVRVGQMLTLIQEQIGPVEPPPNAAQAPATPAA